MYGSYKSVAKSCIAIKTQLWGGLCGIAECKLELIYKLSHHIIFSKEETAPCSFHVEDLESEHVLDSIIKMKENLVLMQFSEF